MDAAFDTVEDFTFPVPLPELVPPPVLVPLTVPVVVGADLFLVPVGMVDEDEVFAPFADLDTGADEVEVEGAGAGADP